MMTNSTAARRVEIAGGDTTFDVHVKRVLAIKPVLARIIGATVRETQGWSAEEIEQMIEGEPQIGIVPVEPGASNHPAIIGLNSEDKVPFEGEIRYDVLTYIMIPGIEHRLKILINVEGQKDTMPGYDLVTRGVYYGARRISAQKDTEFTGSNYDDIKKVYSIWICFDSREDERNTITEYSICKNNVCGIMPDRERYDLMSVIFIRLGGDIKDYDDGTLQSMLMTLFSETLPIEDKKRTLSNEYGIRMTEEESTEVDQMCNYGQGIAERNYNKGYDQGTIFGEDRMAELGLFLMESNRLEDLKRVYRDKAYREQLLRELEAYRQQDA